MFLVERWLRRWALRWPFMVASVIGGWRRRVWRCKPGKEERNPVRIACCNVDNEGENKAAWKNFIRATALGWPRAALTDGVEDGAEGVKGSRCHRLVVGWRDAWRIDLPWWEMLARDLVKVAIHPASHSCPTERRLPDAREGKRWTEVALSGRVGMFNFALCVDVIVSWLGRRTCISVGSGWMLRRSACGEVDEGQNKNG